MSLLGTLANKYVGPTLTRAGDHLMDAAMGIPGNGGERELMRLHDQWLRTAKLGVRYYAPDSRYEWIGDDAGAGPVRLTCSPTWVFVRQTRGGLYTASTQHSYRAWLIAGFQGLTTSEPPKPGRPARLKVTWELGPVEVEHLEEPTLVGAAR